MQIIAISIVTDYVIAFYLLFYHIIQQSLYTVHHLFITAVQGPKSALLNAKTSLCHFF